VVEKRHGLQNGNNTLCRSAERGMRAVTARFTKRTAACSDRKSTDQPPVGRSTVVPSELNRSAGCFGAFPLCVRSVRSEQTPNGSNVYRLSQRAKAAIIGEGELANFG
jgi:hypothetical protein